MLAIAVAVNGQRPLVIDDRRAITEARRLDSKLTFLGSGEMLASLCAHRSPPSRRPTGLFDELATSHRFRLPVPSITDLL
jgi:hypothetical protein